MVALALVLNLGQHIQILTGIIFSIKKDCKEDGADALVGKA